MVAADLAPSAEQLMAQGPGSCARFHPLRVTGDGHDHSTAPFGSSQAEPP